MIRQRIADFLRERRIRSLDRQCRDHMAAGRSDEGRLAFLAMQIEIKARSAGQIQRMEQARGLFGEAE
jgi:hypothetical protein